LLLSVILFSLAGCETIELKSNWRDREITIDGINSEWKNTLMYIEKADILVGLLNDETFLYACVLAESPFIRAQIMRQGFTVWFDPAGGNKKTFGIRFPIGREKKFGKEMMGEEPEPFWGESFTGDEEPDQEKMQEIYKTSLTELEILGPGENDSKRMPVAEAKGIEISLVPSSGMLVYELKVPLAQSDQHLYAVGAQPGKIIGIRLESPRIDIGRGMRRMGGGMPGGGMMPPMGGRLGRGGFGGGKMLEPPKNLKLWVKAHLAAKKSLVTTK
jgi:hypothetical protein